MKRTEAFDIKIMDIRPPKLKNVPSIKVTDIYDRATGDFHPDGLYSSIIFGRPGDKARNLTHAKIVLNTDVMHPKLLKELFKIRAVYREIMEGRQFAIFDDKLGDFVLSDALSGETGYSFFFNNVKKLKLKKNESDSRNKRIALFNIYKEIIGLGELVIIPAGLRDIEAKGAGKDDEHEINKIYRSIVSIASAIPSSSAYKNTPDLDSTRISLQRKVNEVYDMLEGTLDGKGGMIAARVTSRRIHLSTRNVITTFDTSSDSLDSENLLDIRYCRVGVHQFCKATVPLVRNALMAELLPSVCSTGSDGAMMFDEKGNAQYCKFSNKTTELFQTYDGIESIINRFDIIETRYNAVKVDGLYPLLVGDNSSTITVYDYERVQETGVDPKTLRPITYVELFYLCCQLIVGRTASLITRYPVLGLGSIIPTYSHVVTHASALKRAYTSRSGRVYSLPEYPIANKQRVLMDTVQINPYYLAGLGADFDGDTVNFTVVWADESIKEIRELLEDPMNYLGANGGLRYSLVNDITEYTLKNFN